MTNESSAVRKAVNKSAGKKDGNPVIEQVRQLAWIGQHAAAIDAATQELLRLPKSLRIRKS